MLFLLLQKIHIFYLCICKCPATLKAHWNCHVYLIKFSIWIVDLCCKVSKGANIRNRYNQVPHLTQDTSGKVTNSQLDTTNESQKVSPFPAGDHKAHINRRTQRQIKHKTEKNIKDPQKKYHLGTLSKIYTGGLKPV